MVALGALHELREQGVRMVPLVPSEVGMGILSMTRQSSQLINPFDGHNDRFALAQYNKSISHLSKRLNSGASIEVALLACIMFVCVEFLRGDSEPAVNHFRSGMTITLNSLSNDESQTAKASVERIKTYMLPFFNRMELLSTLFGNDVRIPMARTLLLNLVTYTAIVQIAMRLIYLAKSETSFTALRDRYNSSPTMSSRLLLHRPLSV